MVRSDFQRLCQRASHPSELEKPRQGGRQRKGGSDDPQAGAFRESTSEGLSAGACFETKRSGEAKLARAQAEARSHEGRCGDTSPLEGVAAHAVAARGRLSPLKLHFFSFLLQYQLHSSRTLDIMFHMVEILSELFRIVDGAIRQDASKVRNYALLVADKLENGGDAISAKRLRQLVEEKSGELRPARLNQGSTPPVDQESRFPLLELVNVTNASEPFVCDPDQQAVVNEFASIVEKRGVLERHGLESSASLLLYGPPGCGKSLLAQHIAQRLGLPLYLARLDSLVSSFLGSTSKNLRAVFDYAARQPCILFLDEFDAVAKLRDDPHEMGELKRVVNSFLQAFDSHAKDIIVIAATNHDQLLDAAIWRRFQLTLNLRLPSTEQRLRLWSHHAESFEWSDKVRQALTNLSEGLSGAQIVTICQRLKQRRLIGLSEAQPSDATRLLCGLWESSGKPNPPVTTTLLGERTAFAAALQKRDENLFNQTVIAELAGVSKSTLSREMSVPKKKAKHSAKKVSKPR